MYWWNMAKLAEDLREGRVTEKEKLKYLLATFVAWNLIVDLFLYFGGPFGVKNVIPLAVNGIMTVWGILACYRINKQRDGRDFISRMICLGWPSGIRSTVIVLAVVVILIVALSPLPRETPLTEALEGFPRWFSWAFISQYYGMIYVYLGGWTMFSPVVWRRPQQRS